ncbi:MAG: glycosyltransferase [Verrucomicrobiota bacterium]
MRVLHVIPSLSPKHGGPSKALPLMVESLAAEGVEVDVVTTDDDGPGCRTPHVVSDDWVSMAGGRVSYFPKQTEFYKVSLPLGRWLLRHAHEYAVIHVHAVFSFTTVMTAWAAQRAGVPYIIRPLGTLNAWGMNHRRRWLKSLSFRLLDKPALLRSAAIHCTSNQEAQDVSALGIQVPCPVIPLGMDMSEFKDLPSRAVMEERWPGTRDKRVVLYLSRIDEKKNLPVLLEAFAKLHTDVPDAVLLIAGDGDSALLERLKSRVHELGLSSKVIWAGHVAGESKRAALGGADVFVLPSQTENFGIALLEGMAAGKACVGTDGVALACEPVCDGALLRVPVDDVKALSAACRSLLVDAQQRDALGAKAREAAAHFSKEVMAQRLKQLYTRVVTT